MMEEVKSIGHYAGSLRHLALRVKDGKRSAIKRAAELFAAMLDRDSVVVPMPSHDGRATTMLEVANAIARRRPDIAVMDILKSNPHKSNYAQKKDGRRHLERIEMKLVSNEPAGEIVLIDNVIGTGSTYEAARSAFLRPTKLLILASARRGKGL